MGEVRDASPGEGSVAGPSREWAWRVWGTEGRVVPRDPAISLLGDAHPEKGPPPSTHTPAHKCL